MESFSMDQGDHSIQRKWYEGGNIRLLEKKEEVIGGWREMRNPDYWKKMRQQKELKENEKVQGSVVTGTGNPSLNTTQAAVPVPSVEHGIKIFQSHVRELMVPAEMLGNQVGMLASQLATLENQLRTMGGQRADIIYQIEGVSKELRAMAHQYEAFIAQNAIFTRRVADLEAVYSCCVNGGVASQMMEMAPAVGSSGKAPEASTTTNIIGRGCKDADLEAASASNNGINGGESSRAVVMETVESADLEGFSKEFIARRNVEGVNSLYRSISGGALNLEEDLVANNKNDATVRCPSSSLLDANASSNSSERPPDVGGVLISEISGNGATNGYGDDDDQLCLKNINEKQVSEQVLRVNRCSHSTSDNEHESESTSFACIQNHHHTDARQKRTNVEQVSEKSFFSSNVEGVIPIDRSVSVPSNLEMEIENDLRTEHDECSQLPLSIYKVNVTSDLSHDAAEMSVPGNGVDGTGISSDEGLILLSTNGKQGRGGTGKKNMSNNRRNKLALIAPSKVKPFQCDSCEKCYSTKSSLSYHRTFHNPAKHECSHCSLKFHCKSNLMRHFITHTGLRPWTCSFCRNTFNRGDDFASHLRLRHGKSREDSKQIADNVAKKYIKEHVSGLKVGRRKLPGQSDAYLIYQFAKDSFQNKN